MARIHLDKVSLDLPVYDGGTQSLKKHMARALVGGTLTRSGAHSAAVKALNALTLDLAPGDRVGLIGHNGAGKTTLLRVIAGIYEPTGGEIAIEGRVTPLLDIGHGVDPDATGYENITLRGLYLRRSRREINAAMSEIAAFSGLGEFLELPIRTYSAGMLSRLLFSASTHFPSDILLIDEGIVAGDAEFQVQAKERLKRLIGQVGILVIASHSNAFLRQFCSSALFMESGRIVASGPVPEDDGAPS